MREFGQNHLLNRIIKMLLTFILFSVKYVLHPILDLCRGMIKLLFKPK